MRTSAREAVFKYMFARLFNPSDEGLFAVLCKDLNDDDKKFASDLMQTILTNEQSYLDKLQQLSNGYDVGRIYRVDKCALVIAMAEFDCCPQTPVAVIVDEYVNLVAKYSTENSTNFVNGILAEYVKEKANG